MPGGVTSSAFYLVGVNPKGQLRISGRRIRLHPPMGGIPRNFQTSLKTSTNWIQKTSKWFLSFLCTVCIRFLPTANPVPAQPWHLLLPFLLFQVSLLSFDLRFPGWGSVLSPSYPPAPKHNKHIKFSNLKPHPLHLNWRTATPSLPLISTTRV